MIRLTTYFLILFFLAFSNFSYTANFTKYSDKFGIFQSEKITGTTADAYPGTAQGEWSETSEVPSPANCLKKTIVIKNTDGSNSLDYKVEVKYNTNGTFTDLTGEVNIAVAAGNVAVIERTSNWTDVKISTKATVGGSQATYEIYITCRR